MKLKQMIAELERRNPYCDNTGLSVSQKDKQKMRRQGYRTALTILEQLESTDTDIKNSRHFLHSVYGITSKEINYYHLRLYHEEYDGWFDWFHTTGTLMANRGGGATNLGKIKDDEEVAKKIKEHVYG